MAPGDPPGRTYPGFCLATPPTLQASSWDTGAWRHNTVKLKTSKNGNGSPATFAGMFWDHTP